MDKKQLAYKTEQIKNKIKKQYEIKLRNRKATLETKKKESLQKHTDAINTKREKKLARKEKQLWRQAKIKERKEIAKLKGFEIEVKQTKTEKTSEKKKWFLKSTAEIQLYKKISLCNEKGYLHTLDTGQWRHYSGCHGGHYFGKKNNPHMVFMPENIRPIEKMTNKRQSDQEGLQRKKQLIERIGQGRFDILEEISKDKEQKNRAKSRGVDHYKMQFNIYRAKNIEEFTKRGLHFPREKAKTKKV